MYENFCFFHSRMTMTHRDGNNAAKHIQISVAIMIEQPLHVAGVDEQRLLVVGLYVWCQVIFTQFLNVFIAGTLILWRHKITVGHFIL